MNRGLFLVSMLTLGFSNFVLGCNTSGRLDESKGRCDAIASSCACDASSCACDEWDRCDTGGACVHDRCAPRDRDQGSVDAGVSREMANKVQDSGTSPQDDPFPKYCGPDGRVVLEETAIRGTPECPSDKNLPGCSCEHIGEVAACWPGLRAHRNRGICRDGTTVCERAGEFGAAWGPCKGYVLPEEHAKHGAAACGCFSAGTWELDNTSPCVVSYQDGVEWMVSTFVDGAGLARCPTLVEPGLLPPQPEPETPWTTHRLTVDCEGQFQLCYSIKSGDAHQPLDSDCLVARSCVEVWYEERNVLQELPPLPGWTADSADCSAEFSERGGYGEMTVLGLSADCVSVDNGAGGAYVFHRVPYCASDCQERPMDPDCLDCAMGGFGTF
ncbi:MAG: hypothetical protein AAF550_02290 [Myxococcota bacterium]